MSTGSRVWRLLRHLWWDERRSRRWLDDAAAERLRQRVVASEARHRGEIRLCVEAALPLGWLWPPPDDAAIGTRVRERALGWFGRLRVWDTEDNAGVLIYLLLAEHAIEVVADRGLARRVPPAEWNAAVQRMAADLRQQPPEVALTAVLQVVDAWLCTHFPATPGTPRPNELPDAVVRV